MHKEILGSLYYDASEKFGVGFMPCLIKTIRGNKFDLGVVEMEVIRYGNIYGRDKGTSFAGNVYSQEGLCPTINTCGGGNREPMIVEANAIRMVRTEEGKAMRKDYESRNIHHGFNEHKEMDIRKDGVSNTISTVQKDSYICEKTIVAMRGRNPENPSDRTPGIPTEQRLEPNSQGMCNTLTSVSKDNLVMEKIRIKNNNSKGYEECNVGGVADFLYPSSTTRRGRVQDHGETSPTIMAENNGICRIEKVGQISSDGSQYGTVVDENGLSATLQAGTHGYANSCIHTQYRIRKLTPLECWRLMGFSDEDFHKAEQVNSNTQLYKQAGNSIVVDVLEAIFRNLF